MIFDKGFSLIECLIAMFMLAVASISSLKMYAYLEIERDNSMQWMQASLLASSAISQLQQVNSTYICDNGVSATFDKIEGCQIQLAANSPFSLQTKLIRRLHAKSLTDDDIELAKIIEIQISWQDRKGILQQLTMPTTVSIFTNLL